MRKTIVATSMYSNLGNDICRIGARKVLADHGFDVLEVAAKKTPVRQCVVFEDIDGGAAKDIAFAIVVVAGLLHRDFASFWRWARNTRLPVILWGVGACWERWAATHLSIEDFSIVRPSIAFAVVRDGLTQTSYELDCPVGLGPELQFAKHYKHIGGSGTLFVRHNRNTVLRFCGNFDAVTDNICEDGEALMASYQQADFVVTERLHGAMIAAALGVPFVAVPWDLKLVEFVRQWKVGKLVWSESELNASIGRIGAPLLVSKDWTSEVVTCLRSLQ